MTSLDRLLEQTRSWRMVLDGSGVEKVREMTSRLLDSVRRVAAHLAKLLMVLRLSLIWILLWFNLHYVVPDEWLSNFLVKMISFLFQGCDGDMVSLIEESGDKLENCLSILVKQVSKLVVSSPVEVTEDDLSEELEVSLDSKIEFGYLVCYFCRCR